MTLPEPLVLARRARWHPCRGFQRGLMPPTVRPWILSSGSLTDQVRALCPEDFQLRVLRQWRGRPRPDEARALGIAPGAPALLREVALCCGDTPLILARSIIPLSSLSGRGCRLANLGGQPLGALLFADRSTRRGPLAVTRISLRGTGLQGARQRPGAIWGRRAVFRYGGRRLLICEFFLPALTGC